MYPANAFCFSLLLVPLQLLTSPPIWIHPLSLSHFKTKRLLKDIKWKEMETKQKTDTSG